MEKVNNKFLACAEKLMKKIFLNCSLPKRLWFGVVLIGFALTLALPLHTANAQVNVQDLVLSNVPVVSTFWQAWKGVQWVGDVAGSAVSALPSQIAEAIFSTLFKILLAIGAMSVGAASSILKGVLSPGFISWSYTNPATNPLIYEGWGLTRDFANMFLVVVLVFIGLGTALRIGEYEARKTLPVLIGIALLINFTPVICGIIVDAANIIMNFFLSNIGGLDVLLKIIKVQNDTVDQMFKTGGIEAFFGTVLLFIFDIITSIVLLLFAFLFFLRYIAIWMLVILSPIAFVSYILPATKSRIFNPWLHQFIQWSFIGVIAAFFIHLGNFLMARTAEVISSPSPNEFPASLIQSILAPLVALLFLLIGFFVSLSTSAMGASGAINFAQRQTKALPGRLGKTKIAGKASGAAAAGLAAGARGVQRLEQAISKVNLPGVGKSLQVATKPLTWSTRKALTAPVPALLKHAASTRKTSVPASFDQMAPKEQERYTDIQGSSEDRTVLAARMAEKDTLKFTSPDFQKRIIEDAEKMAKNSFYKKEVASIKNALPDQITAKMQIDFEVTDQAKKDMKKKIEDLQKELGLSGDEAARVIHIRTGLKPNDVANLSKGSLKSEMVQLGSQGFTPSHLTKIRESFDAETVREFFEKGKGLNNVAQDKASLEDFYRKNPRLVKWFATSPAGREWDWKGNDIIRQEFGNYEAFRRHMASTAPPPAGGTTPGGTPPPGGATPPAGTPPGGTPPPGGPRGRPGPGTGTPKGTTPTPRGRPGATGSTRQEWEQWSEALRDINRKTTQPPPASSSPGGTPPPSSSGNWGGWPEWGASGGTPPPTSPPSSPPPPRGKTGPRGAKKTP